MRAIYGQPGTATIPPKYYANLFGLLKLVEDAYQGRAEGCRMADSERRVSGD
jgi:hypothetical protein